MSINLVPQRGQPGQHLAFDLLISGSDKEKKRYNFIMLHISSLLFFFIGTSTSLDSIAPAQSIRDGETLVSAGGTFELGFFSPGSSTGLYVGIWYKISPSTVVWVANRETQLNDTSGVLEVNNQGALVLVNGANSTVWSSNISSNASNPIAQLMDSGNLVVRNGNDSNLDNLLWQSFDDPCDTLMPGMKLGWNLETGLDRFLSAWKSTDDPGKGDYKVKIDLRGYPQAVQLKGTVIETRAGSWNGLTFTGYPGGKPNPVYKFEFVFSEKEVYYQYELLNRSVFTRYVMSPFGIGQRLVWTSQTSSWEVISTALADQCDNYALCGANSICNISNTAICVCLKGFIPAYPEEWNKSYWSNGCIRGIPLQCNDNDGFQKYMGVKLPDTSSSWYSKTMDLTECQESCLKNYSCTAYANLDIRNGGSGCLLWFDGVIDVRLFPQGGEDLYIRVPASELDRAADHGHGNFNMKIYVGIGVGSSILVIGLITLGVSTDIWKRKLQNPVITRILHWHHKNKLRKEDMDLPTFDLSIITEATNNFSSRNKLGEGGFGPVYKGTLIDGQQLAVKRLSTTSSQGFMEFKNEVEFIAKLQHRNLVKLLGCCIQGGEKMLIYEYMPNKSLDYFIFDETRSKLLDWIKRFHIIGGIARGLIYLHQDSRLRIIHRDLKTSNVLLDSHLNPKISDFGLARAFGGDQVEANTNRVVETYFGVIVLEIICGKKNREFFDLEHNLNLLGHAWRLWTEERPLEFIDKFLVEGCTATEVIRCINVGLLCVQQKPEDRPDMSSVVFMLNGEKLLPRPNAPGFYIGRDLPEAKVSSINCNQFSPNEVSLTMLDAR